VRSKNEPDEAAKVRAKKYVDGQSAMAARPELQRVDVYGIEWR
jgi:hypothetical protein